MLLIVWSKFVRFAHLTFIWKLFRAKNESTWPTFGFERTFSVFFFRFLFEIFLPKIHCVKALKMSYHILPWILFLWLHQFSVWEWHFFPFLDRIFMNNMWLFREKRAYCCCCCFYVIEMVLFERNLQNCAIFPSARKAHCRQHFLMFFFSLHVFAISRKIFAYWNVLKRCRSLE